MSPFDFCQPLPSYLSLPIIPVKKAIGKRRFEKDTFIDFMDNTGQACTMAINNTAEGTANFGAAHRVAALKITLALKKVTREDMAMHRVRCCCLDLPLLLKSHESQDLPLGYHQKVVNSKR